MQSEKEGQVESVPRFNEDRPGTEGESSFIEYRVPLEDATEIDRRPRTFYKSGGDSNKRDSDGSLDFSGIIQESDESCAENIGRNEINYSRANNRFSSDRNRKQMPHQQLSNDESLQAPRRRISRPSVTFKESAENSHNQKKVKEDHDHHSSQRHNSPSRLRMDGNVVQVTVDSKKAKSMNPASGNINPTPSNVTQIDSTKESLSWVNSDKALGSNVENDDHFDGNQQENSFPGYLDNDLSFNTNASSPANFRPSASQTFSEASSDEALRRKSSSYRQNSARELYGGFKIPEENIASGASLDESDISYSAGTGLSRKCKDVFNFHTVSILIVKLIHYLCCFWCFTPTNELRGSSFPDRLILARLNILSFFFSGIQLAASLWLIVVLFVEGTPVEGYQDQFNLWNNNAIIVLIGCFDFLLLCTCFWTTRIVKEVDLVEALRFLWLLLWILPIVAFLNITAFDFYEVTSIWIRHNWDSTQLWWFRNQLCSPETDESLCLVPIEGGIDYDSEDEWCFEQYNSTDCTEIRDEAQETTTLILLTFFRALASWGFMYMFVMLLIIKSLERIISKPMVQKSREVNVVGWLTFPVLCTALFGSIILFSPYTYIDKLIQPRWVGYLYLITSGLFFVALLMGWFLSAFSIRSNVDKINKSNAALILVVVLFINAFVLLGIIMASFVWSRNLNITDNERGAIACTMNDGQCTNCDSLLPELVCPEWSFEEISSIVRRQLNQSAFMAAIFILYDLNVMVHGFNLRKHLSMYQIDYV